eukprot:XP_011668813.1 PREDICTED: caveolin-1-like isoform X2 [Strongylocentrotus purpuratus]
MAQWKGRGRLTTLIVQQAPVLLKSFQSRLKMNSISHDDTFKESSAIQGFAFMKTGSRLIYEYTHFAIYATLTLIIAPIMSFVWAIFFAIAHICVIWFSQPAIKMLYIFLRVCQLVYVPFVRFFLDPLYKSLSLVFSSIRGQFRLHSSDVTLNMKTIQV